MYILKVKLQFFTSIQYFSDLIFIKSLIPLPQFSSLHTRFSQELNSLLLRQLSYRVQWKHLEEENEVIGVSLDQR